MNLGISVANGKYIARMDADDISAPNRLGELMIAYQKFPEASFYSSIGFRITPGMKGYTSKSIEQEDYVFEDWSNLIEGKRTFVDPGVMFEKEKALSVGGYRTYQRTGMDVDLWLRLMERYGTAVIVNKPLYGRRFVPTALVFQNDTPGNNKIPRLLAKQRMEEGKEDLEKAKESIGRDNAENVSASNSLAIGVAATCFWLGDLKGGINFFKIAYNRKDVNDNIYPKKILLLLRKFLSRFMKPIYKKFKVTI